MKRQYKCCVPKCSSYGPRHLFFKFPVNSDLRQQWIAVIPRTDWVISDKTVICTKHFHKHEIDYHSNYNNYPTVKVDVIPTIFPNHSLPIKYQDNLTFGDLEKLPKSEEYILNFSHLITFHRNKLQSHQWQVFETDDALCFYFICLVDLPRIKRCIKIDRQLNVLVVLGGRIVDSLDLTRILSDIGKLRKWSELNELLNEFGFF